MTVHSRKLKYFHYSYSLHKAYDECIEGMQESMQHLTPNYVDLDTVVESLQCQNNLSLSIEFPPLLIDDSSITNKSGLFCDTYESRDLTSN